jgi:hypothetical protein
MNDLSFEKACMAIDAYNARDPNMEMGGDSEQPKELLYGRRMSEMLVSFEPDASEELRLAVRCQHVGRWEVPRSSYAADKKGYLQWRSFLKKRHAELAAGLLRESGYDEQLIERVQFIIQKKQLKQDAESQTLEDVACLVFLKYYFSAFASDHPDDKVVDILQKTWHKMSDKGREAALQLPMDAKSRRLVERALGG